MQDDSAWTSLGLHTPRGDQLAGLLAHDLSTYSQFLTYVSNLHTCVACSAICTDKSSRFAAAPAEAALCASFPRYTSYSALPTGLSLGDTGTGVPRSAVFL